MLKLPKDLLNHPRLVDLQQFFAQTESVLRSEGRGIKVSRWPWTPGVQQALLTVMGSGQLKQGLEAIGSLLDREQKGLKAAQEKVGQDAPQRLSRILLLSADGSERFYHDAESLLACHRDRTHGIVLNVKSEELGSLFSAKGSPTKALLLNEKAAVTAFLIAIAEDLPK